MWIVIALIVLIAVIADGTACGLSLQIFFTADNILTQVLVFGAGFVITGLVAYTKQIFSPGSPLMLKGMWVLAVLVDGYTTFIVVTYYLILQRPFSEQPDISTIRYDPNNWPATLLAFSLPVLLTGTTMVTHYVLEQADIA